jgi:dTDP-4-amino-4,6-dideoxygalactose transaminase
MYYLKARDLDERTALLDHLKHCGVMAVFHYVPLHSSTAGLRFSRFHGDDRHTTRESERLLRLPLWYGMSSREHEQVIQAVQDFYR